MATTIKDGKVLDKDGVLYLWNKADSKFVSKESGKVLSDTNFTQTEKSKLENIEAGATKTVVDASLSSTSSNPVENKAVVAALNEKVAKEDGKGLSEKNFTADEKTKLANIEAEANKTTVVDNLTSDSGTDALSAKQGKELKRQIDAINTGMEDLGAGDMLKSRYDTDNNGQVDKADDADKFGGQLPAYYAKATDLNNYVPNTKVGAANGVASLGADGKVPAAQLPETAPIQHSHQISDVTGLQDKLDEVNAIAGGKCEAYVFDTVDALDAELAKSDFTANLKTGDVFYIRATDVPDYWWDGTTSTKQILETTKVDITPISNEEIDAIVGF